VVAVRQPCRVQYRAREAKRAPAPAPAARATSTAEATDRPFCVKVDMDLCQGHGVCVNEAPEVFALDRASMKVQVLDETPPPSQRSAVESAVRYCPTHVLSIQDLAADETEEDEG
jgi:sterol 14-demethylase